MPKPWYLQGIVVSLHISSRRGCLAHAVNPVVLLIEFCLNCKHFLIWPHNWWRQESKSQLLLFPWNVKASNESCPCKPFGFCLFVQLVSFLHFVCNGLHPRSLVTMSVIVVRPMPSSWANLTTDRLGFRRNFSRTLLITAGVRAERGRPGFSRSSTVPVLANFLHV